MGMSFSNFKILSLSKSSQKSVFSNSTNNSFTLTSHNFTISQHKWIWVLTMVIWLTLIWTINLRLFFLNIWRLVREVILLVNCNIHFINQNAISWNSISLLKINDISYNQISDWNFFHSSVGTSVDTDFLIVNFFSELQELSFFPPVAQTCNQADKQKTGVNS